ncbi:MAG: nucleoside triphosphate pyrophosphatase [Bdellovibrionota bacterium]
MTPRLILASQSEARQRLLKRLGLRFKCIPSKISEEPYKRKIKNPRLLAQTLARAKALDVASKQKRGAIVIGSDQVLVCGGIIFGKPGTRARAIEQLKTFSGRKIRLLTAVCVIDSEGREREFVDVTEMKFRKLSIEEITEYVRLDDPLQCAGSFKFEERGITLFQDLKTSDPTGIEGLPLIQLSAVLKTVLPAK